MDCLEARVEIKALLHQHQQVLKVMAVVQEHQLALQVKLYRVEAHTVDMVEINSIRTNSSSNTQILYNKAFNKVQTL